MKVKVVKAIAEVLDAHQPVYLPGLGSIYLENLSAKITEDGQKITPPKAKLTLYQTSNDNKALINLLKKRNKLSGKKIKKEINAFSEVIVNTLLNYGEANIVGVCSVIQREGRIELHADKSFLDKYYGALPQVPLKKKKKKSNAKKLKNKGTIATAFSKAEADKTEKIESEIIAKEVPQKVAVIKDTISSKPAEDKSSAISKARLSPPVLKVGEQQTHSSITDSNSNLNLQAHSGEPVLNVDSNSAIASSNTIANSNLPPNSNQEFDKKTVNYQFKDESVASSCLIPLFMLAGLLILILLLWKGCNYYSSKDNSSKLVVADSLTQVDTIVEDSLKYVDSEEQLMDEYGNPITECIIITGVFKRGSYLEKMRTNLELDGLAIYEEETDTGTRIGFKFDCSSEDLASYLNKQRKRYSKKAWYLVPELYVEYE